MEDNGGYLGLFAVRERVSSCGCRVGGSTGYSS
jgi:hypothetical protein